MKRIALFLLIFIYFAPAMLFAQDITLTLDEALALALRDNRDVLLKAEDIKKAKEKIAEARAGFMPTLSFTGGWTDTAGYYNRDLGQTTTQTTLKQYLYKGGKTINTLAQNKYKSEVSSAILEKTKLELIVTVKRAFYTLALAREFAALNKGILGNTRGHLNFTQTRYLSGEASESELLKIKESLSSVQEVYDVSLSQAESSESLLKNLLYLDEGIAIIIKGNFAYEPKEIAYDEAFLRAMKTRPEIKQYESQVKADAKSIEIAKADNRPNIYASWDYYSRSHLAATTTKDWNDYNILGVTFTWPIFDGWATKSKVEQAIVDLKETQLLKEKTIKDIALELKTAYLELKDAISKMKSSQSQVELYKNTLAVTNQQYKAGMVSSLALEDVLLSYQVALFNQKEAIYDYIIAKAKFDKATGGV